MAVSFEVAATGGSVRLTVVDRLRPDGTARHDRNRLRVDAVGSVRGFGFELRNHSLHTDELALFAGELARLRERLVGEARLMSREGWLDLVLRGDGSGRLDVQGTVVDGWSGARNELRFVIPGYDRTHLPDLIHDVNAVLTAYPPLP
jgi:hypothetical protein